MTLDDKQRAWLGQAARKKRERIYGTKSAAYTRAGLNSATWDRIENGEPVRDDRLREALRILWPETRGDVSLLSTVVEMEDRDARARAALSREEQVSSFELVLEQVEDRLTAIEQRLTALEGGEEHDRSPSTISPVVQIAANRNDDDEGNPTNQSNKP